MNNLQSTTFIVILLIFQYSNLFHTFEAALSGTGCEDTIIHENCPRVPFNEAEKRL